MDATGLYDELFYKALRIRLVEEAIIGLYPTDKIQSPVHLSIGQEAVAVGICQSLRRSDLLFGSYRSHAYYLAKGGDLMTMFAELYGKSTGCAGGKAGSMHLAAPDVGFMGSSAVVASTIPHAVGAALAASRLGKDQVVVAVFGDGATEEGVYHESLNFASLHKLPVVFVCENNGLAVHSRSNARQAYSIARHAEAYRVPALRIGEGHDFVRVHELMSGVVELARKDRSPYLLEVETCRYMEHVGIGEDFGFGYRSREELDLWKAKDPLLQNAVMAARHRPAILAEIREAIEFAETSPWPAEEELYSDVL
jgi:TPP-dependent pyruvate/acetoin dehydrogenase alpha subunit